MNFTPQKYDQNTSATMHLNQNNKKNQKEEANAGNTIRFLLFLQKHGEVHIIGSLNS